MREFFRKFAGCISLWAGSPWAFLIAIVCIVVWALTGPLFGYTDTWQLVINTGTTIITFLMVFLIQNTQNREALSMQLKLDELLRAVAKARTEMADLEDLSDAELEKLHQEFRHVRIKRGQDKDDLCEEPSEAPTQDAQRSNGKSRKKRARKKRSNGK